VLSRRGSLGGGGRQGSSAVLDVDVLAENPSVPLSAGRNGFMDSTKLAAYWKAAGQCHSSFSRASGATIEGTPI
jgi:hypothetical protein